MAIEGTVVNGMIVLDAAFQLPEGACVQVEVPDPDDLAPVPELYDREKELTALRESLEDSRAGRTVSARQALADLARKYNLPLEPGE